MSIDKCIVKDLPKITDPRGNITFVQNNDHLPFDIARVYYLYDIPGGAERGGHAHKELQQMMIAISGSFDVVLDDGKDKKRIHLNRPFEGLHITPMMWRELDNFSSGAVCLVLASEKYSEDDYYRNYEDFIQAVKQKNEN